MSNAEVEQLRNILVSGRISEFTTKEREVEGFYFVASVQGGEMGRWTLDMRDIYATPSGNFIAALYEVGLTELQEIGLPWEMGSDYYVEDDWLIPVHPVEDVVIFWEED